MYLNQFSNKSKCFLLAQTSRLCKYVLQGGGIMPLTIPAIIQNHKVLDRYKETVNIFY